MDELTIDDKKYVSSKRAAQVTGYAKDYIGQLCREGRVPARLVGRNWYVLESAISDHRFGPPEPIPASAPEPTPEPEAPPERPSAWEAPRYASVEPQPLPQLNRMEQREAEAEPASMEEDPTEPFMDSWRNWFDHIAEIAPTPAGVGEPTESVGSPGEISSLEPQEELPAIEEQVVEEEINIPIHTVYDLPAPLIARQAGLPPRELLPRQNEGKFETSVHVRPRRSYMDEQEEEGVEGEEEVRVYEEEPRERPRRALRSAYAVIRVFGVLIAVGALGIATIASGYFDTYIGSYSQASSVTGISSYEK